MKQVQSRLSWSRLPLLMSVLVLLILAGCTTAPVPTGSLEITITGLPDDQTADIGVNGPDNYGATLTKDTTLSGLTPGSYSVRASIITVTAVEYYVAIIAPPSATVAAKKTATVGVAYQRILLPAPGLPADGTGTLLAVVIDLPAGVDADVTVEGPEDFSQKVSTSTVLTVAPGMYSAVAGNVTDGDDTYTPTVSGSPAEVGSSGAVIEVSYALDVGTLEVTISGDLPEGVDAAVLVKGANNFEQLVTESGPLDLTPGIYTLSSVSIRTGDIVSEFYDMDALEPIEVMSGMVASTTATYTLRRSGALWLTQASGGVLRLSAKDLAKSATLDPAPVAAPETGGNRAGVMVDGAGDLWVIQDTTETAQKYDASDLAKESVEVATRLPQNSVWGAFDAAGSLWVTNNDGSGPTGTVVELRAKPLFTQVTIAGLDSPLGVAFDDDGNLWVANSGARTVVMFSPAQLVAGGTVDVGGFKPKVTISENAESAANADALVSPAGVAFDAAGNLWVSNNVSNNNADAPSIVKFARDDLAKSGSPAPAVTIIERSGSLNMPEGLAFDNNGDLWVANAAATGDLVRFSDVGSLSGTENPKPATVITVTDKSFVSLAFSPPPLGSLIRTP